MMIRKSFSAPFKPRLFLLALFSAGSHAADSVTTLDPVVVTAKRFPERAADAPIGMTIITADEIAHSTATTLPELLSQQAGIITRDTTGSPDTQVDLRGFGITGDQNTLVLLNGQRLNDIELTTLSWSAISLASIERIEILRGSGAVLYGGGATGGTINIITRSPTPGAREATVGGGLGSYATREWHGRLNVASENLGLALNANRYASDNYRANNRVEQENVAGELRLAGENRHLALRFGRDSQDLRLPGARTAAQLDTDRRGASTPNDYATRDGSRLSLGGASVLGAGELAAELGYRDTGRTSLTKDYSGFGLPDTYIDTHSRVWFFTPRFKVPYESFGLRHNLIVGLDVEDWDYDSRRATSQAALGAPTARVIASQQNLGLYFQHHTALGPATQLTLGARAQRVKMSATDTVNPAAYAAGSKTSTPKAWELALRHNFTRAVAAYGRVGRSFRTTTVDESYSQFGGPSFDAIVTLLEPQTSHDYEAGLELREGGWRFRASAFASYLQNEIYFFAPTFSNINLPPTRRQGLELDASAQLTATLRAFANASVTDAKFRSGTIGGVEVTGKTIPLVPRDAANAGIAWKVAANSQLNGVVRYVGKQRYDNDQTNTFPTVMPSYTVVDLKFVQSFGRLFLSAGVNNLFNRHYYSYAIRNAAGTSFNAYPQRERNFLVTAEYRF